MEFEVLKTERLLLRKLVPEVYDHIYKRYSDPELKLFLGLDTNDALQTEKNKYAQGLYTYNRRFVNFQLLDKATEKIIGGCGFHTWYIEHHRAEIGYALNDDADKQKGLMTEAMKAVIYYGFIHMNLHRIEALIGPANAASIKLVTNAGFKKEGHLREHYFKNNVMQDSLIFSLLKSEYNP